jgi:hypothetical protein
MALTIDSRLWKEVAAGMRLPTVDFFTGDISVDGSVIDLVEVLLMFDEK